MPNQQGGQTTTGTMRRLLLAAALVCTCTCAPPSPLAAPKRRVNWWFNALNTSFGVHQAAVARAHRSSLTGVYQWIQPNGFIVQPDGTVALPPPANIVAATEPLLALGQSLGRAEASTYASRGACAR